MRWLLLALLAGCTTSNPKFGKGGDLAGVEGSDGASQTTADGATGPGGGDAASPSSCASGPRTCGGSGSEVCTDGAYVADRTCPPESMCADGYCAEPSGARSCSLQGFTSDALCGMQMGGMSTAALACQPFVQNGAFVWVCAPPTGADAADAACTTGSTCRSGVCASNGHCFRACAMNADCGKQGNATTCTDLMITVEGITTSARGCVS